MLNMDRYGNTSAASIPIALDEAVQQGRIKQGSLVMFGAFGAGLTWASALNQSGSDGSHRTLTSFHQLFPLTFQGISKISNPLCIQESACISRPGLSVGRDGKGAVRGLSASQGGLR